ncbi:MAG: hypothetical protein ACK5M1_04650 [Xanthomarina gelatinilytica]|uniref:hypothetical protein n=1 Tax=Xanthomarina gelatinilytica TaxID=1137281 RepID=UPI003A856389
MSKYTTIQAIKAFILRGNKHYNGIPLPSPQRSGTYFQQASYAQKVAEELYETHFINEKR